MASAVENGVLARWNTIPAEDASGEILSCCGSTAWASRLAAVRPFADEASLLSAASEIWKMLDEAQWMEAFRSHPRIGERHAERATTATSASWSASEQRSVAESGDEVKRAIAEGNRRYEERFGRIFIICATGKQPAQILAALKRRLTNDDAVEVLESAQQQEEIMLLRLKKWLRPEKKA